VAAVFDSLFLPFSSFASLVLSEDSSNRIVDPPAVLFLWSHGVLWVTR